MARKSNRLFIDAETRVYYKTIREEYSYLNLSNNSLFSLALAVGFQNGIRKPLIKKEAFIRYETINQDLFSIMILLAAEEYGIDDEEWIDNPLNIFDMAEEYANAGIEILMQCNGNPDLKLDDFLTLEILELYDNNDFKLEYEKFVDAND